MQIFCRACGLWMTNGYCLHGDVDTQLAALGARVTAQSARAKTKKRKGKKGC